MSNNHYRNVCMRNCGRPVEIRTKDGRVHRGTIERVDNHQVYLRPFGRGSGLGGFGYGLFAFGIGIALGAIGSLIFLRPRYPYYWW